MGESAPCITNISEFLHWKSLCWMHSRSVFSVSNMNLRAPYPPKACTRQFPRSSRGHSIEGGGSPGILRSSGGHAVSMTRSPKYQARAKGPSSRLPLPLKTVLFWSNHTGWPFLWRTPRVRVNRQNEEAQKIINLCSIFCDPNLKKNKKLPYQTEAFQGVSGMDESWKRTLPRSSHPSSACQQVIPSNTPAPPYHHLRGRSLGLWSIESRRPISTDQA